MSNLVRISLAVIAVAIITAVTFYFWASSANYSNEDYVKLIEYDYSNADDSDSIYSVITYNIGYLSGMTNNLPVPKPKSLFDSNLIRVYDEFKKLNADIICLQEIDFHSNRSYYVNQQEEVQMLGYSYAFQAANWDKKYLPFP